MFSGMAKGIPAAHFDSLTLTSLETSTKSSTYLGGYVSGFLAIYASARLNHKNAHDGAFFTTLLAG